MTSDHRNPLSSVRKFLTNFLNCFSQIIEDMIVNKKMKNKLTQANIDPYSSEGRSEIYCRFVLENPRDLVSQVN